MRAISPLLVALVLLVVVVLRQPLPSKGFSDFDDEEDSSVRSTETDTDVSAHGKDVNASAGSKKSGKDCAATDRGDVERGLDQVGLCSPQHGIMSCGYEHSLW